MPNRSAPPHVHFAPGLTGTLRWMGYWASSRSTNARRALGRQWHTRVRPALAAHAHTLSARASTSLRRTDAAPRAYDSLADAVRHRGWADVRN